MIKQFFKYTLIQVLAYAAELSVFVSLVKFVALHNIILANICAKLTAGLIALTLHKYITFKSADSKRVGYEIVTYFSVLAMNMLLSSFILVAMLYFIKHLVVAKVMTDVLTLGLSFLLTKHVVFTRKSISTNS